MKTIPVTKLRNFKNELDKFKSPTKEHLRILEDYNRYNNYTNLIDLYKKSKEAFFEYQNIDESFLPSNLDHRESLPVFEEIDTTSTTQDAISVLQKRNPEIHVDDSDYNFKYIQREVPTCRTPKTEFEAGIKKSGAGGIDFIGFNVNDKLPILGEIKVKSDKNAFYALIQLLMYLSELSTPSQIERIMKNNPFENISEFPSKKSVLSIYNISIFRIW